jgi:CSLREA domain-containing protein
MTYASILGVLGWIDRAKGSTLLPTTGILLRKAAGVYAFCLLIFLFSVTAANATTYTVNTLADHAVGNCNPADCTLREAIVEANGNAGADVINFQAGLTGTITLLAAQGGQLLITEGVTINGPGARILSISGNGTSRVFQINPLLLAPTTTANISGLTITGGVGAINTIAGVPVTPGPGGGILNTGGATLNLTDVNLSGNNIPLYGAVAINLLVGGGVATVGTDTVTTTTNILRCTIANNTAVGGGGGVTNIGTQINLLGGTSTISNSTITSNVTAGAGGGILNTLGTLNLTNDTISDNSSVVAGGGVVNLVGVPPVGVVNLRNTIIARNNAKIVGGILSLTDDVLGIFNSQGNNLIGNNLNATASFAASVFIGTTPQPNVQGDLVGSISVGTTVIDPRLGAVQNNGGQTNTRALLSGSPAIDHANNCVTVAGANPCGTLNTPPIQLLTDQRSTGFSRLTGAFVDIGAYELQGAPTDLVLIVNTLSDHAPNGCTVGDCTLREAILDTNANPGADFITFDPLLIGGTITLDSGPGFGELSITDGLTITGPAGCARNLTVSGNGTSRVFEINPAIVGSNIIVNISGLTITQGNGAANTVLGLPVTPGPGGGILNTNGATLNLNEVNLSGNNIPLFALVPSNILLGGGIATVGTDTISTTTNISRSLISGNAAAGGGGGVSNTGTQLNLLGGSTNITNTTITNNSTIAAGGGIINTLGTLNLTNATITDNTSLLAGGGVVNVVGLPPVGVVTLRNTIIARNNAVIVGGILNLSDDVLGVFNSLGNNLIGNNLNATASFTASVFIGGLPQPNAQLDLVGSVSIGTMVIDPKLGPLQNNGGCTDTRALQPSSPALDAANNCVNLGTCSTFNPNEPILLNDQRGSGFNRRVDGNADSNAVVDIGAYEQQFGPTAAGATITGRVTTSEGLSISKATVTITDTRGLSRNTLTNSFGYFTFSDVRAGATYAVSVQHKRYTFEPRIVTVNDDLADLNFTALGTSQFRKFVFTAPILSGENQTKLKSEAIDPDQK